MGAALGEATDYTPAGWFRLLVTVASGPHWWAMHLGLVYLVVPETCELDIQWTLHLITLGTLVGAAVGGWVSLGVLRRARPYRERDRYALRDGYLGWLGLSMSVFFGAVIIVEGLPAWFLSACW